jgi:hypothetical protein
MKLLLSMALLNPVWAHGGIFFYTIDGIDYDG